MDDSVVNDRGDLTRAHRSRSSLDLLEQYRLDVLQMRPHELLRSFGIFALDRLKYFLMMAQHGKPAVCNAFDAPFQHQFLTGVVQDSADSAIAGDLG
jgi:hypothetical protein